MRLLFGKRPRLAGTLALLALTVAAFLPAIGLGFIWDDGEYVLQNPVLQSLEGLRQAWFEIGATQQYYPMVHTTLWLEYRLWQLDPAGYHAVNVLLHGLSACLLWSILRLLRVPGAWLAAAVFAVHPVQVESVAWITERKNVLSGLFYLAAASSYLSFALKRPEGRRYGLALGFFVLAMLSKTTSFSLPAALLLVVWWKTRRLGRAEVVPLLPFFAVGIGLAGITLWIETTLLGASGAAWDLSVIERTLVAGRALWFYAGKLLWPAELIFVYPRWEIDAGAPWQYLAPLAYLALLAVLWLRRAGWGRPPLVAALFFAGTLVPALGFFDVYFMRYSFVADHFQYLACIGPIALAVAAGRTLLGRRGARTGIAVAVALLSVLMLLTWRQLPIYRNEESLWRDTLRKNPEASIAHNNLGNLLLDRGQLDEGRAHLEEAVRIDPDHIEALYSLGTLRLDRGRPADAVELLSRAVELDATDVDARENLAVALMAVGRTDDAGNELERLLDAKPDDPGLLHRLAQVRVRQERLDEAAALLGQALRATPDSAELHTELGMVEFMRGRVDAAVEQLEAALRSRPDYFLARHRLGLVMLQTGRPARAARLFRATLETEPTFAEAYRGLAQALERLQDREGAARALARYRELSR